MSRGTVRLTSADPLAPIAADMQAYIAGVA
jgi:hypothetical protein